ncbi:TauD/TfdA family dioxygenase [Streptomyces sp. NBC_01142]|uniref:guanitoxin biosynthesis L-enduracididine beta-hydroxylase GntD n=1 Tax=Streptomyces sp. NBC_01142 TaxID=2975865 RepID=UPI002251C0D1|nr:guanitoxin biosynthesis L-enduracididine beta-hydroxylase GntD [Streptomyces sp. NBC_01142]MCX4820175.1 TauD/TfdA family dioxygenase [Streptomyces sp. NBC_01142]
MGTAIGSISKALAEELLPRAADGVPCLELSEAERALLGEVADAALDASPGVPLERRLDQVALLAHEIPLRVKAQLTGFRLTGRPYGGLVLSNLPVDEALAGPTPTTYSDEPASREAQRASALLMLLGSLLGDPVSYMTQQRGRMVLDLFPIAGHEKQQLGSSSTGNLEWHNEDAFHPLRADWIMLLALRNHDKVPTTFAPVQDIELDPRTRELLFEEHYVILPDESHTVDFNSSTVGIAEGHRTADAFRQIEEQREKPRRTAVLSGSAEAPSICIDPAFMPRHLHDGEPAEALQTLISGIDAGLRDVVIGPGDLLILDNKRAVHGRRPFTARYDGTDRWLRRVNVLADLRRADGRRHADHGRALA